MRVGSDHVGMNERRSLSGSRIVDGARHRVVAGEEIAAVNFLDVEIREGANQLRYRSTGSAYLDGNRDRVAVILDEIDDRQLQVGGSIERLPELTFARRSFSSRYEDDLVVVKSLRDSEE